MLLVWLLLYGFANYVEAQDNSKGYPLEIPKGELEPIPDRWSTSICPCRGSNLLKDSGWHAEYSYYLDVPDTIKFDERNQYRIGYGLEAMDTTIDGEIYHRRPQKGRLAFVIINDLAGDTLFGIGFTVWLCRGNEELGIYHEPMIEFFDDIKRTYLDKNDTLRIGFDLPKTMIEELWPETEYRLIVQSEYHPDRDHFDLLEKKIWIARK